MSKGHLLYQSATANQEHVFDFTKADFSSLCSYLMDTDFSPCLLSNVIEFMWSIIKNAIYSGMNLFIPKVRLKSSSFHAGLPLNSDISQNVHVLSRKGYQNTHLLNCLINSQMEDDLVYKTQYSKYSYESQLIHSFPGKCNNKIYDYINTLTNSYKVPPLLYLCSSQASSDRERTALFNSFFHSVFTVSHFTLPSSDNLSIPPSMISDLQIDTVEVKFFTSFYRRLISCLFDHSC